MRVLQSRKCAYDVALVYENKYHLKCSLTAISQKLFVEINYN